MLFDKYVSAEYRVASGVNYVYVPHPTLTHVPVNIQPFGTEFTNMNNGIYGKTYRLYTTNSGIVENFRLTVSGTGQQFIVRGRQDFNYFLAPHYEFVVTESDQ